MAYTTQYVHSGNAVDTTLASDVTGGVSTTISLTSATGWPSPTGGQLAVGTLNPGTSSEVKFTYSGKSGNDLTGVVWDFDDTTASGTYSAGVSARHSISAEEMDEANAAVRNTVGKVTTAGDLLYATAANALSRLGIGTARQVLATNAAATAPEWVASLQSLLTAQGDIVYASAANTPARLAKGTAAQVLTMNAGATAPEWATPDSGSSGVLAETKYAASTTYSTSSGTASDIDATNLAVTFDVPASGVVNIRASVTVRQAANGSWGMCLREGGAIVAGSAVEMGHHDVAAQTKTDRYHYLVRISGLTPGASKTYKLGWAITSGSPTITAYLSSGDSFASYGGPALIVVEAGV